MSTGAGQTVAVIGSGVDPANAQFGPGQVLPQTNLLAPNGTPDCDGTGTFAAGIVAARPDPATTFVGVAPNATILPIRYTQTTSDSSAGGAPDSLATAIQDAARAGAGIILVVTPANSDSPALRNAVAQAVQGNAVVIAPASGSDGNHSYPADDPGTIAVGSVDSSGNAAGAESGDYIALAAPGVNLVSLSAGAGGRLGHDWGAKDPGFAAAYVAGAVADLRAYRTGLSPQQVLNRLTLTADRAPGGAHDPKLGWGVLNAYAAISAELPANAAGPQANTVVRPHGSIAPLNGGNASTADPSNGLLAVLVLLLAGAAGSATLAVRRARRRGWRPGRWRAAGSSEG